MSFIYELLRAGTSAADSDTGAEVARKINDNFKNVSEEFQKLEESTVTVKSSDGENNVSISEDGTMEVTSLNVNKLVQDENDFLILDGNYN